MEAPAENPTSAARPRPSFRIGVRAALSLALSAGLLGGGLAGALDALLVVATTEGNFRVGLVVPAAVFYAFNGILYLLPTALVLRLTARRFGRPLGTGQLHAWLTAGFIGVCAFGTAAYRTSLDVFQERLTWGSPQGVALLSGCAVGAAVLTFALAKALERSLDHRRLAFLRRPLGAALALLLIIVCGRVAEAVPPSAAQRSEGAEAAGTDNQERLNVLFVVVDTWRADRVPAWGYRQGETPALDRFARDAVRFDRFYVNSSWTRPSFATLYTGRYPSSHQVFLKTDALPDEVVTMAEVFQAHDYATAGFVTNYNTGPSFNYDQGFETYRFLEPDLVLGTEHGFGARVSTVAISEAVGTDIIAMAELLPLRLYQKLFSMVSTASDDVSPGTAYHDAETLNREVISWLDDGREEPFFLTVGYMDPHHPFFRHPYDGIGYTRAAHEHPAPEDVPRMQALYDGEITYWDQHFGALMQALRDRGLYDDTLIVVTSDHGEEFNDHGGFYHGTTIYEEVVHVPLFVKLPQNRRAGTTVRHWVEAVDLMPSILRRADLPVPAAAQGGDWDDGATQILTEENHEGHVLSSLRVWLDGREWLLITANEDNPRGLGTVELYSLDDDPTQQRNVSADHPELTEALRARLAQALEAAASGGVERAPVTLDDAARRRLCALGYLRCDDAEASDD